MKAPNGKQWVKYLLLLIGLLGIGTITYAASSNVEITTVEIRSVASGGTKNALNTPQKGQTVDDVPLAGLDYKSDDKYIRLKDYIDINYAFTVNSEVETSTYVTLNAVMTEIDENSKPTGRRLSAWIDRSSTITDSYGKSVNSGEMMECRALIRPASDYKNGTRFKLKLVLKYDGNKKKEIDVGDYILSAECSADAEVLNPREFKNVTADGKLGSIISIRHKLRSRSAYTMKEYVGTLNTNGDISQTVHANAFYTQEDGNVIKYPGDLKYVRPVTKYAGNTDEQNEAAILDKDFNDEDIVADEYIQPDGRNGFKYTKSHNPGGPIDSAAYFFIEYVDGYDLSKVQVEFTCDYCTYFDDSGTEYHTETTLDNNKAVLRLRDAIPGNFTFYTYLKSNPKSSYDVWEAGSRSPVTSYIDYQMNDDYYRSFEIYQFYETDKFKMDTLYNEGDEEENRPFRGNISYGVGDLTRDDILNMNVEKLTWYDSYEEYLKNSEGKNFTATKYKNNFVNTNGHISYYTYGYAKNFNKPTDLGLINSKAILYRDKNQNGEHRELKNSSYVPPMIDNGKNLMAGTHLPDLGSNAAVSVIPYNLSVDVKATPYEKFTLNNPFSVQYEECSVIGLTNTISYFIKIDTIPKKLDNGKVSVKLTATLDGNQKIDLSSCKIPPDSVNNTSSGQELVWNNISISEAKSIKFEASVSTNITRPEYERCTAKIEFIDGASGKLKSLTDSSSIYLGHDDKIGIRESIDKLQIPVNGEFKIDMRYRNFTSTVYNNYTMLNILPYNGDIYGSSFSGDYIISDFIAPNDVTIEYTTQDPTTIKFDAKNTNVTDWKPLIKGVKATAVRVNSPKLEGLVSDSVQLTLTCNNNNVGDIYGNRSTGRLDGYNAVIYSKIVDTQVGSGKIYGKVWNDKDEDGTIKSMYDTDTYYADRTVNLLNKDLTPVLDENSNPITAITDSNGDYVFDNLSDGEYIISMDYSDIDNVTAILSFNAENPERNNAYPDAESGKVYSNIISISEDDGKLINCRNIGFKSKYLISKSVKEEYMSSGNDLNYTVEIKHGSLDKYPSGEMIDSKNVKVFDEIDSCMEITSCNYPIKEVQSDESYSRLYEISIGDVKIDEIKNIEYVAKLTGDIGDREEITNFAYCDGSYRISTETKISNGYIYGYIWKDNNDDDTLSSDSYYDILRSGIKVSLLDKENNVFTDASGKPITAITDNDGKYEFKNLIPGDYKVKVDLLQFKYINLLCNKGTAGSNYESNFNLNETDKSALSDIVTITESKSSFRLNLGVKLDAAIKKVSDVNSVADGGTVKYKITVTNNGILPISDMVVDDNADNCITISDESIPYVVDTENSDSYNTVRVFSLGVLEPGKSKEISYKGTINVKNTNYTGVENVASIRNTDIDSSTYIRLLRFSKHVYTNAMGFQGGRNPIPIAFEGEDIWYFIDLSGNYGQAVRSLNETSKSLPAATITDVVPEGLTVYEDSISGNGVLNGNTITWKYEYTKPELQNITTYDLDHIFNPEAVESGKLPPYVLYFKAKVEPLPNGVYSKVFINKATSDIGVNTNDSKAFVIKPQIDVTKTCNVPTGTILSEGDIVHYTIDVKGKLDILSIIEEHIKSSKPELTDEEIKDALKDYNAFNNLGLGTIKDKLPEGMKLAEDSLRVHARVPDFGEPTNLSTLSSMLIASMNPKTYRTSEAIPFKEIYVDLESPLDKIFFGTFTDADLPEDDGTNTSMIEQLKTLAKLPGYPAFSSKDATYQIEYDAIIDDFEGLTKQFDNTVTYTSVNSVDFSAITDSGVDIAKFIKFSEPKNSNTVSVTAGKGDLELTKISDIPESTVLKPGDTIKYTLRAENKGYTDIYDIEINDIVPEGLTVTNVEGFRPRPVSLLNKVKGMLTGKFTNEVQGYVDDTLNPGEVNDVIITCKVNDLPEGVTEKQVKNKFSTIDSAFESNELTHKIAVPNVTANLTVNKIETCVGDKLVYTVNVKNDGGASSDSIHLTSKVPEGTTAENGKSQQEWNIDSLAAGEEKSFMYTVTIDELPKDIYSAIIEGQLSLNDSLIGTTTTNVKEPGLIVEKSSNVDLDTPLKPDDRIKYTIKVTNKGVADTQAVVADEIPAGLTLDKSSIYTDANTEDLTQKPVDNLKGEKFLIKDMKAGSTKTITYECVVDALEGDKTSMQYSNKAYALYTNAVGKNYTSESNVVNNVAQIGNINFNLVSSGIENEYHKVGDKIEYTIHVENTGDGDETNIVITNKIPSGTSLLNKGEFIETDGLLSFTIDRLKAHSSKDLKFSVTINDLPNGITDSKISNIAQVNGNDTNEVVDLVAIPKLSIDKTVNKENGVSVGEILTYTIKVVNNGLIDVQDVEVEDTIPNGVTLQKDSISDNGVFSKGIIKWNVNKLAVGETKLLEFKVTVDDISEGIYSTTVSNIARVNGLNSTPAVITVVKPNLGITIASSKPTSEILKPSDKLLYTVTVDNTGAKEDSANIVIPIPDILEVIPDTISKDGVVYKDNIIEIPIDNIAPNSKDVITFEATIKDLDEAETEAIIAIQASLKSGSGKELLSNKIENIVQIGSLEFYKKGSLAENAFVSNGDKIVYTIGVNNTSNVDSEPVTIVDKVPNGCQLVGDVKDAVIEDNTLTFNIDSLKPNENKEFSFTVEVTNVKPNDVINNVAKVNGKDTNTVSYTVGQPNLEIVKVSNAGEDLQCGNEISYLIRVTNTGNAPQDKVSIKDTIPENTTLVDGSISDIGVLDKGEIVWNFDKLNVGESKEVSFKVRINNDGDFEVSNTAKVNEFKSNTVTNSVSKIKAELPKTGDSSVSFMRIMIFALIIAVVLFCTMIMLACMKINKRQ